VIRSSYWPVVDLSTTLEELWFSTYQEFNHQWEIKGASAIRRAERKKHSIGLGYEDSEDVQTGVSP
jgi:hypothetical protein